MIAMKRLRHQMARLPFAALGLVAVVLLPGGLAPPTPAAPAAWGVVGPLESARLRIERTVVVNAVSVTASWRLAPPVSGTRIEGFADATSVLSGQWVWLAVSATSTYHVEAYRMGYYGGARARLVWTSGAAPAQAQPAAVMGARRMVRAPWHRSMWVSTKGWPTGLYLLKLVGNDGAQSYVPLVVRSPSVSGAVLVVASAGTWQAYNYWGGANLYRGGSAGSVALRSRAVSFDRPLDHRGLGLGLPLELPLLAVLERLNIRYSYVTDLDLGTHPEVLSGIRGVVILGHSEYWSPGMRGHVTAARGRGVDVAWLGANDVYWRIRSEAAASPFAPTVSRPDRVVVCYKSATEDPVHGAATTVRWDQQPSPLPPRLLLGESYGGSGASAAMVIRAPTSWMLRGTNVRLGTALAGLIGPEYDSVLAGATPAPIRIVAHSPVVGHAGPRAPYSDLIWYRAPSGALVVDVGTYGWGSSADSVNAAVASFVRQVTTNIIGEIARS